VNVVDINDRRRITVRPMKLDLLILASRRGLHPLVDVDPGHHLWFRPTRGHNHKIKMEYVLADSGITLSRLEMR
jgi:hypothetical protein